MAADSDAVLLESARVRRQRLRAAFLHGHLRERRTTKDNVRRFIGSTVLAAVACAGCAGWSFIQANAGGGSAFGLGQQPFRQVQEPLGQVQEPFRQVHESFGQAQETPR